MLVLTRKEGEALRIGADVRVVLLGVSGGHVRIGIEAPRELTVLREEVHERVVAANRNAATPADLDLESVAGWIHPKPDPSNQRQRTRPSKPPGGSPPQRSNPHDGRDQRADTPISDRTTPADEETTGRE